MILTYINKIFSARVFTIVLLFSILDCINSGAEVGGYSSLWTGTSTNAFYVDSVGSTLMSGIDFGLNFYSEKSDANYYLDLSYLDYGSFAERNFMNASFGFNYNIQSNKTGNDFWNFNGSLSGRLDKALYDIYDYIQPLIAGSFLHYFNDNTFLQFSYTPRMRFYLNYSTINYLENSVNAYFKTYFKTKTNINGSITLSQKNYLNSSSSSMGMMNYAISKNPNKNFLMKKNKWGKIIGNDSTKNSSTNMNSMQMSGKSFAQILFDGNIAQNIDENLGLSCRIGLSRNLNSINLDTLKGISSYNGEAELFDDSYSFENFSISPTITVILPWDLIGKINYFRAIKNYNYFAELESGKQTTRKDIFNMATISLSKNFEFEKKFINNLNMKIDFSYYLNNSNSYLFNYTNKELYLSCEVQF